MNGTMVFNFFGVYYITFKSVDKKYQTFCTVQALPFVVKLAIFWDLKHVLSGLQGSQEAKRQKIGGSQFFVKNKT